MRIPAVLAVCAGWIIAGACTAASGPPPAPPAAATATTVPAATAPSATPVGPCPVTAAVCTFARGVQARLARGDVAGVLGGARGMAVTCTTGVNPGLGADFPLCSGAVAGEVRYGFDFGRFQSEGGTLDRAGLEANLSDVLASYDPARSDALGGGALRAFTIGCPVSRAAVDCSAGFALVFSGIVKASTDPFQHTPRPSAREFLMLTFTPDAAGAPGLMGMHTGLAQLNMLYLTGGIGAGLRPADPAGPRVQYAPFSG